jgi:hypothetical protein
MMKVVTLTFLLSLISSVVALAEPSGNSYYFTNAGSDTNPCTRLRPCKTIAHLNNLVVPACSTVNLNGGDTFTDAPLNPARVSYNAACPTTFQPYGTGSPILNPIAAQGRICIVTLTNPSGVVFKGITIIAAAAANFGSGICVYAKMSGITNITIENNNISGVMVPNFHRAAIYINQYRYAFTNVNVLNNNVHDLWGNLDHTADYWVGIQLDGFGSTVSTGIVGANIAGNTVYNTGGRSAGGIEIQGAAASTISDNLVHNIGFNSHGCGSFIGIELYAGMGNPTDSIVTKNNEIYNVATQHQLATDCDMGAFDFDVFVTNSTYEYGYAHDNSGPCVETTQNRPGNVARYNICINNNAPHAGSYLSDGGNGYPGSSVTLTTTSCSTAQAVFIASVSGGVAQGITGQSSVGSGCSSSNAEPTTCGGCGGSGATINTVQFQPGGGVSGIYWKVTHGGQVSGFQQTQNGASMIIYNNTDIGALNLSNTNNQGFNVGMFYGLMGAGLFINNIFVEPACYGGVGGFWNIESSNLPAGSIDFNDYYTPCRTLQWRYHPFGMPTIYTSLAAWTSSQGADVHSLTSNPSLSNLTTAATCGSTSGPQPCPSNAQLMRGSAMTSAGVNLTQSTYNLNVGSVDYYGIAIPGLGTCYNIGAYGTCP